MMDREKALLNSLFDNIEDAIVLVNALGAIQRANEAFLKLFQYATHELLDQNVIDIVVPDFFKRRAVSIARSINRGDEFARTIVQCVRKDGTFFPCEFSVVPFFSGKDVESAFLVFHNLTREHDRDEQLYYAMTVVKESSVVLFRWKAEEGWPVEYVSENISQWGYTPAEIKGEKGPFLSIIKEEDRQRILQQVQKHEEAGDEEFSLEYRVVTRDGKNIWVDARTTVLRDKKGKIIYLQGTISDVSFRKEAELAASQNFSKVLRAWEQTIGVMALIAEKKNPLTLGHQKRVAILSRAIAEELGLPDEEIGNIEKAALIHDIGEVEIPSEILSKPGPLNEVEYNLVQTHAEAGYIILSRIEFPWPLAETVYQHHERLDGSGYPRGLKGDEILLSARIIGVADIVEAMCSHRPYRPALGLTEALEELDRLKGSALDPQVVDACVCLFKKKGFNITIE